MRGVGESEAYLMFHICLAISHPPDACRCRSHVFVARNDEVISSAWLVAVPSMWAMP